MAHQCLIFNIADSISKLIHFINMFHILSMEFIVCFIKENIFADYQKQKNEQKTFYYRITNFCCIIC